MSGKCSILDICIFLLYTVHYSTVVRSRLDLVVPASVLPLLAALAETAAINITVFGKNLHFNYYYLLLRGVEIEYLLAFKTCV